MIEYAPGKRGQPPDRLYVPTDQLDEVTRYVGGEAPTLHRLGGADWAKAKGRARKAVRQIASELIRLYSARMASPGSRVRRRTPRGSASSRTPSPTWRPRTSSAPSTRSRRDMERPVPMDRLICGDVGYGKTEIAVRAAFKAVQDGKQVAVLVPTTLLVQQHFVHVHRAVRAVPGEGPAAVAVPERRPRSAETLRGLADGTVDVVIGTHRLLSPETRFARLGLVIIDEEQRFGVEHKEYLKRLRTEVDVLAMSATPDPADAGDGRGRDPGDVHHPDPAGGAAPGADLRRRPTTRSRSPRRSGASCSATARSSSCTTGSARSARSPPSWPSWCPRRGSPSRTGR